MADQITHEQFPLVRYECGCIGFLPDGNGNAVIIDSCTKDVGDADLCFFMRPMTRTVRGKKNEYEIKPFQSLEDEERQKYFVRLQSLIRDGHLWQELRRNLKV